ncbi:MULTISPECIES: type II toxin-antitoxin system VapB family antitoxin [Pseudorhizobium]|jgi:antitoxin VapB|uniref:30S ribosomal protein S31 n=1 Tax=Pseudorhizobium pelagicum TaxID=1509405 RepID=A0A922T7I6_9HYPH|nr:MULTISPECIES: type II toxin-antitoxin system VapB family antitoxin [Pseudorhizobium]MBU1317345.1 type II toxin-antitoxin system VapB family antitoxin [Alphaproteobacteria bacterium]MDY6963261.1 type II toxin-antitoxin system VapB family antitoxin [Pseudomonadota bacterium]KEQ04650.1 30S ribosomal protein S31 [Pseudorhizobium pelagicum]KEQ06987.1 30S ribosomal protein S31 [Pseudorhizobium pelagicum]MBU1551777.1 type II toxin-antitoxin system VapB family antitoxin [Alphaproteobacteria bacteri|tara:strand:+ start:3601 stop:3849 length:249 start_codon:yes stop_codon:yes gene_type:complete
MPLYVRDERVNQLAEQAQKILNAPTKTDAIRQALERVVGDSEPAKPMLADRLKAIRDRYQALGSPNPDFDEKQFLDEMWGND